MAPNVAYNAAMRQGQSMLNSASVVSQDMVNYVANKFSSLDASTLSPKLLTSELSKVANTVSQFGTQAGLSFKTNSIFRSLVSMLSPSSDDGISELHPTRTGEPRTFTTTMLLLGLGKTALSKEAAISRGIAVAAYHVAHLISETKTESLLKAQQEALEKAKYEAEKQKKETEKITGLGDDERRKVFLGLKDLKNQQGSLDTVSVEKLRYAMETGQLSLDEAAAAKSLLKQKDNVYSASPVYASHLRKMIS